MLKNLIQKIMPNTAEPTVNPDDNAKSICEWYRNIVAGEESYFQKAAECQLELNHAKERISDLRAELRANPTPIQRQSNGLDWPRKWPSLTA